MSLGTVIVLVALVIGILVAIDTLRKMRAKEEPAKTPPLTANEALPTQTGRYRAQQALAASPSGSSHSQVKDQPGTKPEASAEVVDDDEGPLPDPMKH